MQGSWIDSVAHQFHAALEMVANAIGACPAELWFDRSRRPEFAYTVFHTLFWTDLYLFGGPEGFRPPAPYTLDEMDPAGIEPAEPYSKAQMLAYVAHCHGRCRDRFAALTDQAARERSAAERLDLSVGELLLYNLRHVQHHAGQLQVLLRQAGVEPPAWVRRGPMPAPGAGGTPS